MTVFELLYQDGPLTPGQLGVRLAMPSGSMTALIDRLEYRGFVERKDNPRDRRSHLIHLTDQARSFGSDNLGTIAQEIYRLVSEMPVEERKVLEIFFVRTAELLNTAKISKE